MCAWKRTRSKGFYGPTGRSNWVGPVGEHELKPHAKDKKVAEKTLDSIRRSYWS